MAPSCSAPSQRSLWKDMQELRYLSDNFLEGSFSTGCWTNGSMAGNPANASSVRSTRLSRQPATSKMMLVLVYSGCPRSCLMAHSDRGHRPPFSGPPDPLSWFAIKQEAEGVSPPRVLRDTPSLVTDKKKEVRRRKSDDMISHAFCRTSRSSSPGRPSGLAYSLPPEAMREDALDPTPCPETSSEGPNATRPQNVVPAVKTRLLFRAPPIHGHNRRTGLPSRLPSRSIVTFTGYITNLHSSRGRSNEQRRTSRIRKGESTRRRSFAPVPAPLIISEGIFFFFAPTP